MIGLAFRVVRNIWLFFMCVWLLVLAMHVAGCSTKPADRRASAELNKRTFGSPRPIHKTPPVRHE